jgi:hypothetical protein
METPCFFLDSDSPFNCVNDSIKILLSYIRTFLRKKKNKVGKNKFYIITNRNKSKNQVDKLNSQMVPTVNFNPMCYLFYKTAHLTLYTQRIEI